MPGMTEGRLSRRAWGTRLDALMHIVLIGLFGLFAYIQLTRVIEDHVFTSVPFAVFYTLLFLLSLIRRRPVQTTARRADWALAVTAWLPFAMLPADTSQLMGIAGSCIASVGTVLAAVSVVSLGRNFGVVAANRGLSMNGAYRVLRHPLYAAECLAILGNLIANPHPLNAAIVLVVFTCIPLRIITEERLLGETDEYRSYMQRVPWRLVPGLY